MTALPAAPGCRAEPLGPLTYIPCPTCAKFPVATRRQGGRVLVYHVNPPTGCAYVHGADDDAHGAAEWAQHCREAQG